MATDPVRSPIDAMPAPDHLVARVVDAAGTHLHGFDVGGDLARHYDFGEVVLIALTGEAPEPRIGRLFNQLLIHACVTSIREAPGHVALLARLCGARTSGVAASAAVALTEQSRESDEANDEDGAEESTAALREWLEHEGIDLRGASGRDALLRRGLAACGLQQAWQREMALSMARWPVVVAEAMAAARGDVASYPIRQPPFAYEADE